MSVPREVDKLRIWQLGRFAYWRVRAGEHFDAEAAQTQATNVHLIPADEEVRRALVAEGIDARPVWKPMHLQPVFRDAARVRGEVAAALFRDGLCLPSGPMPPGGQARGIAAIREALGAA